ncbi:aldo/keto reductase [Antrihabitans cavernicola]|uniref:Aldo/keto reductase n=1 Tax=Antrihabitans cavernicola TaxID=2495913 RepID=A0A5A7SEX8_9NOCA|nr:aldo/keto reductase [Spelaeibacter cavernicola]KAA0023712.1 aldo/keto reductase [Spelaeibacter cavernicola]
MKQRTVGRSGLRVSRIGLGTLTWGRETEGDDAAAQLSAFVDAGGTLVDTSPAYGGGVAQRILAELLGDVVPRDLLVLSGSAGIFPTAGGPDRVDCSRRSLLRQLDESLAELGTDHLDIWRVGIWDPTTPVHEVAAALDFAITSGKARYVAASGHAGWQLATIAGAVGHGLIATQHNYSLLDRGAEFELIPAADHHGVGFFAASPLAGGVLTGKYRNGVPNDSRGADELRSGEIEDHLTDRGARVVQAVVTAADGLGMSPLAVALAWVRDRPGVSCALAGARDLAQLTGVLAAEELELPKAIAAALDDVSA